MKTSTRDWAVRFEYDRDDDVVFVYPCGDILTREDASAFFQTCYGYYGKFGRKIDVIVLTEMCRFDTRFTPDPGYFAKVVNRTIVVSYHLPTEAMKPRKAGDSPPLYVTDTTQALAVIHELRARDSGEWV